jgi:hypothetical protein
MSDMLIAKFDETEELIKKSPDEENKLISNYIKLIIQTNTNNSKSMVRSSTFKDEKLPFDITIHNNFQRYNNYDDLNSIQEKKQQEINPILIAPPTVAPVSTAAPETFNNYFKNLNEGFKDYYAFNR